MGPSNGGALGQMTPAARKKILQALEICAHVKTACRWAGVPQAVFWRWMELGAEKPNSVHGQFRARVEKAEGLAEMSAIGALRRLIDSGNVRALTWLMERKWPERWGPEPIKVEVKADGEAEKRAKITDKLSPAEIAAFGRQIAQIRSREMLPAPETDEA